MSNHHSNTIHSGRAICPYCAVGCHVDVAVDNNRITRLRGAPNAPVNYGLVCPKGALLDQILELPGRLIRPMVRHHRHQMQQPTGWPEAITAAATQLQRIIEHHGPNAVALYGSGQLDTEAWYLGNKLFKGFIGSNHVDSNSRLCMTSSAVAYRLTLGSDGPPPCWDDLLHTDVLLVVGSNMAEAHPVAFQRLKARRRIDPSLRLIVVDPRRTLTAQAADVHVQLAPGSDIAFCNLIARLIIDRELHNHSFIQQHTNGFDAYLAMLRTLDIEALVAQCGVPLAVIEAVVRAVAQAPSLLSCYCMGLNQSTVGTWNNTALINLHLLLGQIGRSGAGPFSLTGQPNAMGGRELGGLAHALPGYRFIDNPTDRADIEAFWKRPPGSINRQPGLTAVEMFGALNSGELKAIWIVCNNPLVSLPNLKVVRQALDRAELVIVQDAFETETTAVADLVLPAAQWIEKSGTMTNAERRVTRTAQLAQPPGLARPDWWIFDQIALRMGYEGFGYADSAAIWNEYRALTKGRLCDQWGMTNERLAQGSLQWPCPDQHHPGTERLYTQRDFPTPDGRASFVIQGHQPPPETASAEYPIILITGRIAAQWHTMTRTGKIAKLHNQAATPWIDLHPLDAQQRGLSDGDPVIIRSMRGNVQAQARTSDRLQPGVAFMPFHWGAAVAENSAVNDVTIDALDPLSKQPEYKYCAIEISAARAIASKRVARFPPITHDGGICERSRACHCCAI